MKSIFTLVLCLVLSKFVLASGSQPGNWQWKHNDGTPAATIGQGIVISHAQDVYRIRFQVYSGSLTSNNNGHTFLQYICVDETSDIPQNGYPMPAPSARAGGDGGADRPSYDKYDRNNAFFSSGSSLPLWHTVADANVVHDPTKAESTAEGAAFVMSGMDGMDGNVAIYDQKGLSDGIYNAYYTNSDGLSNGNGILQLGAPPRPYNNFPAGSYSISQSYYTSTNGNIQGTASTNYNITELEFSIKVAYNSSTTKKSAIKAGKRYFFRLRGWGTKTSAPYIGYTGFSSPNGNDNGTDGTTPISINGGTYTNIGDYHGLAIMPYVDIDPNIIDYTLPVTYSKPLTASLSNGKVDLLWASATEVYNKGYSILAGTKTNNLTKIGFVSSKAPNGNTGSGYTYSYEDTKPNANTYNYYQLRQEDLDGKEALSNVASVYVGNVTGSVSLFPNPATTTIYLKNVKLGTTVKIIGISGQIVKTQIASSDKVTINIEALPSSVYVAQAINSNGKAENVKFIKK